MPVVFLHGSGSSRKVFERQLGSALADDWRLIALDLPGHGESFDASDPADAYSVEGLADTVEEVLDQLGIRRAAIFGWSLGGHIAIELLARNRLVAGLMLSGAPPVPPGLIGMLRGFHPSFDILLASKEAYSERDAERFETLCFDARSNPAFRQSILRTDGKARAVFSKSMMRGGTNQRAAVLGADVPVAFVNGRHDPFVRLSYFVGLKPVHLFDDEAHVIESAGHAPFWTDADEFNPLLARFLSTVAGRQTIHEPKRIAAGA